jgi:sialidase-1
MNKKDIVHSRDGSRNVWVTSSRDNGATWETPREITASVKRPEWTWYATGPGVGIQLSSGRMIIPCDHHEPFGSMEPYSHVIFSDDHGQSWKLGGTVAAQTHECQAVELSDGSILMNMRCQSWEEGFRSPFRRMVARSQDGGLTWKDVRIDDALKEPMCQASLIGIAGPRKSRVLVFANPADTKRVRMTIKVSRDEGRSWNVERTLHKGPSAYSCLAELPGRTIGCLYERGAESPYDEIALARFRLRG